MSWQNFQRFLSASMSGGFVTFGGISVGLVGAVVVECTAHRTLYRFFPHWYCGIEHLYGLEPRIVGSFESSAQTMAQQQQQQTPPTFAGYRPATMAEWRGDMSSKVHDMAPGETFPQQVHLCALTA